MTFSKIKKILRLSFLALTLCVSSPAYSKQTKDHTNTSPAYQYGSKENPAFINIITPLKTDKETPDGEAESKRKILNDKVLIGIGAIQGVIFFLQLIVFGLQAKRLRETVEEMKQGTEATKMAANAADLSAKTLIKSQRAFVISKTVENIIQGDLITFFHIWENCGSTPTKSAASSINVIKQDSPLPEGFSFADLEQAPSCPFVLGPKSIQKMQLGIRLNRAELLGFFEKKKFFYAWGWAKYFDIFDPTVEHITKFCYELIIDAINRDTETGEILGAALSFITYHKNNCADEGCI
jgi:hypothetical protein